MTAGSCGSAAFRCSRSTGWAWSAARASQNRSRAIPPSEPRALGPAAPVVSVSSQAAPQPVLGLIRSLSRTHSGKRSAAGGLGRLRCQANFFVERKGLLIEATDSRDRLARGRMLPSRTRATPRLRSWVRWTGARLEAGAAERRGSLVRRQRDPAFQEGQWRRAIAAARAALHPVGGNDAPLLLAARLRPASGGVGDVRGDAATSRARLAIAPGPLVQEFRPCRQPTAAAESSWARAWSRAWIRLASSARTVARTSDAPSLVVFSCR